MFTVQGAGRKTQLAIPQLTVGKDQDAAAFNETSPGSCRVAAHVSAVDLLVYDHHWYRWTTFLPTGFDGLARPAATQPPPARLQRDLNRFRYQATISRLWGVVFRCYAPCW